MELSLSSVAESLVRLPNCSTWVAEEANVFILSDRFKIVTMNPDGLTETIWVAASEEVAYSINGYFDERLSATIYSQIAKKGIEGFQLLKQVEYKQIDQPNGSTSLMETAKKFGLFDQNFPVRAHKKIVSFGKKVINLFSLEESGLHFVSKNVTKGKAPLCAVLHPKLNLILYGTNRGEVYGQYFDEQGFGKTAKVDQLPNACYQLLFDGEGRKLFICGVGCLRIFEFEKNNFTRLASLTTAARSFVLAGKYLILNKGIHGIDAIDIEAEPKLVTSLDVPFAINRMEYLESSHVLLITSASATKQEVGIVQCNIQ